MAAVDAARADQEMRVADVERQLAARVKWVRIGNRLVRPEPAWAAAQAIRGCWDRGLKPAGQTRHEGGYWQGRGETGLGNIVLFPIGRFPG